MLLPLLLIVSSATTAAFAGSETLKSKAVLLKAPPKAPFLGRPAGAAVDEALVFGDVRFPAVIRNEHIRIATEPGNKGVREVASGRKLRLTWRQAEQEHSRTVYLRRGELGLWRFAVLDAKRLKIAGASVTLVDANGDGTYDDLDEDGLLLGDAVHLLPLRDSLVIGRRLVRFEHIEPDGSAVRVTVTAIKGGKAQLAALDLLNALRLGHGLSPVRLAPEHCKGCSEHAEYLVANGWSGAGLDDPHVQDPRRRKATEDGARVAGASIIMKSSAVEALKTHYLTYFHRVGIMHPRLEGVGINATMPSIAVMDVYHGRTSGEVGARMHAVPYFCPSDGADDVPQRAHPEFPKEPVDNLARRGWPLMVWFPEAGGEITNFGGELHLLKRGRRQVPILIARPSKEGVAGLVPVKPMGSNATYEAVFRWRRDGKAAVHKIRFRTQ